MDATLWISSNEGELRGAVDCHEQIEFALSGANLGQVDMEVADRVAPELFLLGLLPSTSVKRLMPCRSRQRCK